MRNVTPVSVSQNWNYYLKWVALVPPMIMCVFSFLLSAGMAALSATNWQWEDVSYALVVSAISLYIYDHFGTKWDKWEKEHKDILSRAAHDRRKQDERMVGRFLSDLIDYKKKDEVIETLKAMGAILPTGELSPQFIRFASQMEQEKILLLVAFLVKFASEIAGNNDQKLVMNIATLIVQRAHDAQDGKILERGLNQIKEKDPAATTILKEAISEAKKQFEASLENSWGKRRKAILAICKS